MLANDPALRTGYLGDEPIVYRQVDSQAVWQGDIILPLDAISEAPAAAKTAGSMKDKFDNRWYNGRVPYWADPNVFSWTNWNSSLDQIHSRTHIRFFKIPNIPQEYALIMSQPPGGTACQTYFIGRARPTSKSTFKLNKVDLPIGCYDHLITHELGHVLGMAHEMNRDDRDGYVEILWNNIQPSQVSQFYQSSDIRTQEEYRDVADFGTFDFASVMMYGPAIGAVAGKESMKKLDGQPWPLRPGLSAGDVAALRWAYPRKFSGRKRDFNGDGKDDMLLVKWDPDAEGYYTLQVAKSGSALSGFPATLKEKLNTPETWFKGAHIWSLKYAEYRIGRFAGGDSKSDLLVIRPGSVEVMPSNGSQFGYSETGWTPAGFTGSLANFDQFFVGDFTGDGKDDVGVAYSYKSFMDSYSFKVLVNNGTGFNPEATWLSNLAMGETRLGEYQVGYFNNDSKADLLYITWSGEIWVALSTGTGFGLPKKWKSAGQFGDLKKGGDYLVGDLSCDGFDDLLYINPADNSGKVMLSNGSGFGLSTTWFGANTFGNRAKGEYRIGKYSPWLTPIGTSCDELVFIQEDGQILGKRSKGTGFHGAATLMNAGGFGKLANGDQYH